MNRDWKAYQEEVAVFFRSLGWDAETDAQQQGARTRHNIDVLVRSIHAGFDFTWVIECKLWSTPVSKLHVLGLRQIVNDLGADRGVLLSESGFQAGAFEAAALTNVQLTSLADLEERTKQEISLIRLRELFDRVEVCNERYWSISKSDRIKMGLRSEVGALGYSGNAVISYCRELLSHALRGQYPIVSENLLALLYPDLRRELTGASEVVLLVEPLVSQLEEKLAGKLGADILVTADP